MVSRLYARQQEFYRGDRILIDHVASRALPEILSQYPTVATAPTPERVTQLTSVIRSRWFDQAVQAFIDRHPHGLVVNIGIGLCTRYWRLPTLHPYWFEVASAKVMHLRQTFFTIVPREQDITADLSDLDWLQHIPQDRHRPTLFVMEGVCMYLTEAQNRTLFAAIAQRFPGAQLLLDVVSPKFAAIDAQSSPANASAYSSNFLGDTHQSLTWGLRNVEELRQWSLSFTLMKHIPYLLNIRDYPERIDPWMKQFWPILEPFLKESAQILSLQLQEP